MWNISIKYIMKLHTYETLKCSESRYIIFIICKYFSQIFCSSSRLCIVRNDLIICRDVTGGGALRGSKLWCTRRQRITDACNIGGRRARALSLTDPSVSLAKCGRELLCARHCCPRSARRGWRKPRGTREASKTTATPTPTDWWVNKTANITVNGYKYHYCCLLSMLPSLFLPGFCP